MISCKARLMAAAAAASLCAAYPGGAALAQTAGSALAAQRRIEIPAQDLGQAVMAFSRATGVAVALDPKLARGKTSRPVNGTMSAEAALRGMVAGLELDVQFVNGSAVLRERPRQAQEQAAGSVDELVVVGYAAAMKESLDAKRRTFNISDTVSADDMGELPTSNVAESVARLPGVNAVRNHTTGEGDRITVRGMSTELNSYSMNGVRMGGVGSRDDNFFRGVRLSFLPPEGIDSITVTKTLTPDRDGDALGGSVDIRTPTAFDFKPLHIGLTAQAGFLDKFDKKRSGEASISFGRQFNDRIGLYVTGSYARRASQFEQNGGDGDNQPRTWYANSESRDFDTRTFVMRGMDLGFGETLVERWGVNGTLDYRGEDHQFHLRGQYNKYSQEEFLNRLNFRNDVSKNSTRLAQVDPNLTGLAQPDAMVVGVDPKKGKIYGYTTGQIVDRDKDGLITDADRNARSTYSLIGKSGAWDPQGFRLRRFWEGERETGVLSSVNLGGVSRFGAFTVDYDVSYSHSEDVLDDGYGLEFRTDAYGWYGNKGVEVSSLGDTRFPKWVLNQPGMAAVQDPKEFKFSGLEGETGGSEENLRQGQFNVLYDVGGGWLKEVKAGAKYYRSERQTYAGTFMDLERSGTMADFAPYFGKPVNDLFNGQYTGLHRLGVVLDNDKMLDELALAESGKSTFFGGHAVDPSKATPVSEDSFNFTEQIFAAYAMAKFEIEKAQVIAGVRYERTKNIIEAWNTDPVKGDRFTKDETDYANVLPSIHVNYAFAPDLMLRGAIWTSFARPDIARMSSAKEYGYNSDPDGDGKANPTSEWLLVSISQGNPDLKPLTSVNYDASLEWYNGRTGAYSVAAFYKDIRNFLYRSSSSNIRNGTAGENVDPNGVVVSQPNNGKSAEVYGIELSGRQVLHWLPAPFDGLGIGVNATFQKSKAVTGIDWHPPGFTLPLMETPERIFNLEVFYEKNGWEAYASYSYQSEFLEGIQDFGNDPYEQDYSFVDLTLRRRFGKQGMVSLEIQNLFDNHTYWYTFGSSEGSSRAYIKNGRSIGLGVNWTF